MPADDLGSRLLEASMGLRYDLRLYKGATVAGLRTTMVRTAKSLGGSIQWGQTGKGNQDLRLAHSGSVHTVYLPYQALGFDFCQEVGATLDVPWLELRIQEGSLWDYALFRGQTLLDTFSVCPQYWDDGETLAEELKQWAGKPEVLARAWELPVERVQNYLVNWGYHVDTSNGTFEFQRKGKAYPTDEHDYGDYEQFYDVLRALGGEEPQGQHTIYLPEPGEG